MCSDLKVRPGVSARDLAPSGLARTYLVAKRVFGGTKSVRGATQLKVAYKPSAGLVEKVNILTC